MATQAPEIWAAAGIAQHHRSSMPTGTWWGTVPAARSCPRWDGLRVAMLVQCHRPQISPRRAEILVGGKWQHQGGCWAGDVQVLHGARAGRRSLLAWDTCRRQVSEHRLSGGSKTGPDGTCNTADTGLLPAACAALRMVLADLCRLGGLWPPESREREWTRLECPRLAGGELGQ